MVAIPDSTVLHKSYEKKEDKLQQKFEAQGLQNCRSRNADLNFGTIRRYKLINQKRTQRKENEGKLCIPLYKLREGKGGRRLQFTASITISLMDLPFLQKLLEDIQL